MPEPPLSKVEFEEVEAEKAKAKPTVLEKQPIAELAERTISHPRGEDISENQNHHKEENQNFNTPSVTIGGEGHIDISDALDHDVDEILNLPSPPRGTIEEDSKSNEKTEISPNRGSIHCLRYLIAY